MTRQDALTSEKVLLSRSAQWAALGLCLLIALVGGCQQSRDVVQPGELISPYPYPKVWAVAPMRNETGTSLADGLRMADQVVAVLQSVKGIEVLPTNRVIEAMTAAQLESINTPGEAEMLMRVLKTDGLIVGSMTRWDPYDPPKIGLSAALYARQVDPVSGMQDLRPLTYASTPRGLPGMREYDQPFSVVSGQFDAAHGDTLQRLLEYAEGRTPADSPSGYRRYLLSMDLYSEFVAYELVRRLFATEWQRLRAQASESSEAEPPQE
jgi:hypothetical protein